MFPWALSVVTLGLPCYSLVGSVDQVRMEYIETLDNVVLLMEKGIKHPARGRRLMRHLQLHSVSRPAIVRIQRLALTIKSFSVYVETVFVSMCYAGNSVLKSSSNALRMPSFAKDEV